MKNYKNASSLKRFSNLLIDSLIIGLLCFCIFLLTGKLIAIYGIPSWLDTNKKYDLSLTLIVPFSLYYLISEGVFKTTIGKVITKTKIIRLNGDNINFYNALTRTLCRLIPLEPFSYLSEKEFGWHDRITDTRVINN